MALEIGHSAGMIKRWISRLFRRAKADQWTPMEIAKLASLDMEPLRINRLPPFVMGTAGEAGDTDVEILLPRSVAEALVRGRAKD